MYKYLNMFDDESNTALHARFIVAWRELCDAAAACRESILHDAPLPCWAWRIDTPRQARSAAAEILTQFLYTDDQSPRESIICPAVLGATGKTLRLAAQLNTRKDRVRTLLQAMDKRPVAEQPSQPGRRKRTMTLTALVLAREGLTRLHRMQVYRHLRLILHRPDRIALGWARTRRVKRRHVDEVRAMLEARLSKAPYPGLILADMERLTDIGASEWLALVDQEPLHVRANLTWPGKDAQEPRRRQVTLALPMLFAARPGEAMPTVKPLPDAADATAPRVRRGGRVLETEPLLRTLPVYRYRGGCR